MGNNNLASTEKSSIHNPKFPFSIYKYRSYTMIFALIAIAIFFQIMTDGTFLNSRNLAILMRQMSITAVITTGMVLLIISGNFDLAVGSMVALTGGIAAVCQVWFGWSTPASIIAAIAIGVVLGVWQGFWVAYKKIPSFIVTLGGMMIFRGIILRITDGKTITPMAEDFTAISQSFVPKNVGVIISIAAIVIYIIMTLRKRNSRKKYGFDIPSLKVLLFKIIGGSALILLFVIVMNDYLGIPIPVIILLCLVLFFIFLSQKTVFGRRVYAIGGNIEAAKFSGINIERIVFVLYIFMGILSAISGILLTSRLDGATASAGTMFEMDAIAACVIGGTSLMGGQGTIMGAIIGALIMASLDNGMSLMNISSYYQYIVKGLVLILAVWFDVSTESKQSS